MPVLKHTSLTRMAISINLIPRSSCIHRLHFEILHNYCTASDKHAVVSLLFSQLFFLLCRCTIFCTLTAQYFQCNKTGNILSVSIGSTHGLLCYAVSNNLRLQASCKQLRGGKVVHLRVMLKNIVPAGKNASAILKDPTGTKNYSELDSHLVLAKNYLPSFPSLQL